MIRRARKTKGRSQAGSLLELDVGPVATGGHCVARHEGRVVFVRHALPGERVRAQVTEGGDADAFWRADAVEILTPSPDRVRPPCRYAGPGKCGGCDWQHAALPAQRRLKAAVVEEQLRLLAGIQVSVEVEAVPGDVDGLGWRSRVRFAVDRDGRAGLHPHRSHAVLRVDTCLIAQESVDAVGAHRLLWPGTDAVEVIAASSGERMVVLSQSGPTEPSVSAEDATPTLSTPRLPTDVSVVVAAGSATSKVRGRKRVTEQAAGREWRVSGSGFWQVHRGAADMLCRAVVDLLQPKEGEAVIDLYSGVGLFAGVLAERVGPGAEVVAIEADRRAAGDARRNLHGMDHVLIVEGRVEKVLVGESAWRADIVVLDPPRAGAGRDVCSAVAGLGPRAIAYVSCDPASLARDLAIFADEGFQLTRLRAFDAFPMTRHVECLALLEPAPSASS